LGIDICILLIALPRVTRRLGGNAQILKKVAQTVAKPKNAKIFSSKLNLKVQNNFILNPFLTLKIPTIG
jgi:hypothetical protein